MPNPLIAARQKVTSKAPQEHAPPAPMTPIVEHYEGVNNPYRGIESHGVEPNNEPSPPGTDADTKLGIHYEPEPLEHDPIPVTLVQKFSREFRRNRVHKMSVNAARTQQFVGHNDSRSSVLISNPDAALSFYVGFVPDMNTAINGFEVKPGKELTLFGEDEIYIKGTAVDPAVQTVQAVEQYSVQE